jgi:hypothetical protein
MIAPTTCVTNSPSTDAVRTQTSKPLHACHPAHEALFRSGLKAVSDFALITLPNGTSTVLGCQYSNRPGTVEADNTTIRVMLCLRIRTLLHLPGRNVTTTTHTG